VAVATNGLDDLVGEYDGTKKSVRPLYRPDDLKAADPAATVFILDAEEDVDKLIVRELVATINCVGNPEFAETLRDRKVAIFFKNDDDESCRTAWRAAKELLPVATSICVLALTTPLLDFFEKNGGTREQLLDDIERSGPVNELKIEFELARLRGDRDQQQGAQFQSSGAVHGGGKKPNQADVVVALAITNAEFFHDDDKAYATVDFDDHRENWPIKSKRYWQHVLRLFYAATGKVADEKAVRGAINVLCGKALFDGPQERVHVRIAANGDTIYLDLADHLWRAVEIGVTGWRIIQDPPVKFRRPGGMLPLPDPKHGGSVNDLRQFLNIADEDDFTLTVAWLLATLRGWGPYPILVIHGEQGCGKSTRERVCRDLVDPNVAPLRRRPRDEQDLMIAATNGHIIALDNLSYVQPWLSDALCVLATGGGLGKRELYSDAEEVILNAVRPIMLNGIEELATRGDILDRSIISYLPVISEEERQEERKFHAAFEAARPRILGALLDAVSTALRRRDEIQLDLIPRMADFAVWVAAAEPGLGWREGRFLEAYERNRDDASALAIQASAVAGEVQKLGLPWEGTAEELLVKLNQSATKETKQLRSWPADATRLSNAIRRITPNLRELGILIEFLPRQSIRRPIRISKLSPGNGKSASSPSPPSGTPPGYADDDENHTPGGEDWGEA
jgi:hypothetical protein